jgi:hypothetical protein
LVVRYLLRKVKSPATDAVLALAVLGRSGGSDNSQRHDEALAEAFRDPVR